MPLRDLAPGAGVPGPRRGRRHPESDWGQGNWPPSSIDHRLTRRKTNLQKRFLLRCTDMVDLEYEPELWAHTNRGIFPAKRYLVRECERRAWEIYGGPRGLEAEKAVRAGRRARRNARAAARGLPPPPPGPGPRPPPRGQPVIRRAVGVGRGRIRAQNPVGIQAMRARSPEVAIVAAAQLPIPFHAPAVRVRVRAQTPEPQLNNAADYDSDVVVIERFAALPLTPPASPRKSRVKRALSVDESQLETSKNQLEDFKVAPSTPKARKGVLDLTGSGKKAHVDLTSPRLSTPSTPSRKKNAPIYATPPASGKQSKSFFKMPDSGFDSDSDDTPPPSTPSSSTMLSTTPSSSQRMKTMKKLVFDDNTNEDDTHDSPTYRSPKHFSRAYSSAETQATPKKARNKAKPTPSKKIEIIVLSD